MYCLLVFFLFIFFFCLFLFFSSFLLFLLLFLSFSSYSSTLLFSVGHLQGPMTFALYFCYMAFLETQPTPMTLLTFSVLVSLESVSLALTAFLFSKNHFPAVFWTSISDYFVGSTGLLHLKEILLQIKSSDLKHCLY